LVTFRELYTKLHKDVDPVGGNYTISDHRV
jgi:hypothetical protein